METIVPIRKPYQQLDSNKKLRMFVMLDNGTVVTYARLVMMNFLHTSFIPKQLCVHHIDQNIEDDRIENLQLIHRKSHSELHHPRKYQFDSSQELSAKDYGKLYDKMQKPDYYRKKKMDIEFVEKVRAYNRQYSKKFYSQHKDDPIFREKERIRSHENYLKRRELELINKEG